MYRKIVKALAINSVIEKRTKKRDSAIGIKVGI
jgi:hypothetical protein